MKAYYRRIEIETEANFCVRDITEEVTAVVRESGVRDGVVALSSLHTTCAVTINENEARLLEDIRNRFLEWMPPDAPYLHNDLHLRENVPPDEPKNAHAHLLAMVFGNGETLCLHGGELQLGRYQAILFLEMDGPRRRQVAVQVLGGS